MRKILLFALLLLATGADAQFLDNNALYFNGGVSRGNYFGARLGVNIIHKEKYSLQAGLSGLIRGAKSKPDDYTGGLINALFLGLASPYDEVESYELLIGRVVRLRESEVIRLNLKAGATLSTVSKATNWKKESNGFIGPNYSYENIESKEIGLIINPEVEFLLLKVLGVAVSPYGVISKRNTALGVEFKLLLGLLK